MGAIQGACASSHASAICAGVALEPWDGAAKVASAEFRRRVDLAGEESLAERAVGDEADAEFLAGVEDGFFGPAPPERVLALDRGDGLHGVGAADGGGRRFGHAVVADLPGLDEGLDGAGELLDGCVRVDAVLVVDVDRLDAEAL